jgi:hypothetical protein
MLIDFDQNTLANMTAALEYVCNRLDRERDTSAARKRIADAMIVSAKSGRRNYVDFQDAGIKALAEIMKHKQSRWLRKLSF